MITLNEHDNKKLVQSPQVVSSQLGDDVVIMHPDTGKYLALNPVAAAIFNALAQPHTPAEIVDMLMQQYQVSKEQCTAESLSCIHDMLAKKLVQEA